MSHVAFGQNSAVAMMVNAVRAAAQVVPAAGESCTSVRCSGTNGWQSRWLWQKRRTTPHEDRRLPLPSGRRSCKLRTKLHGERPHLTRGRGQAVSLTLGLPVLAGASGEAVDSSALSFLTAQALESKRKEEEEG